MNQVFTGKVAIITGAASGIGRATAQLLAERGASVCIADINERAAEQVASTINQQGGSAIHFAVDVSSEQANADLVGTIQESLQIADEGKARRAAAEEELKKMEGELRDTLAAAKARKDGVGDNAGTAVPG